MHQIDLLMLHCRDAYACTETVAPTVADTSVLSGVEAHEQKARTYCRQDWIDCFCKGPNDLALAGMAMIAKGRTGFRYW